MRGMVRRARLRFLSPIGVYATLARSIRRHPANQGRVLRPFFTVVAANVLHSLLGQPVVAPIGLRSRVLVEPDWLTPAEASVLFGNPPDHLLTAIWTKVLGPGDVALDVGANKGVYSILAAERGASVIALEPSSATAEVLATNLRINDLEDLVEVRRAAAGAAAGTTLLTTGTGILNHVVESEEELSEERLGDKFSTHRPTGVEEVEVVTLDEVIGDRRVAAMKLDVEGQEEAALRGCERALSEHRIDYVQIESNATAEKHYGRSTSAALEQARRHGYEIYGVRTDGSLFPETTSPRGHDVLLITPEGRFWQRYESVVS